jgi:hypothetical protein
MGPSRIMRGIREIHNQILMLRPAKGFGGEA